MVHDSLTNEELIGLFSPALFSIRPSCWAPWYKGLSKYQICMQSLVSRTPSLATSNSVLTY